MGTRQAIMKAVVYVIDASIDITGALVAARREAELLQDHADLVLVLPTGSRVPHSLLSPFSDVLKLPMPQIRKHLPTLAAYLPALLWTSIRLRRSMRSRRCERLQINDFYLMHGLVLRLLGYRGRIVTWLRIDPWRFGRLGRLWLWATRWSSNELVAVSRFIQSRIPSEVPTRLIYQSREPEHQERRCTQGGRRLLFVGNYIPGKGQEAAIAAFERIADEFPDAQLCFVGGDMGRPGNRAYRQRLQSQAAQGPAASQIEFHERTEDPSDLYRNSYAALNFSVSESFSITCQDAAAFGLPIVATRCGGPEEIVEDGKTGFLVPVGDVDAMAKAMRLLLADPALASRMGAAAAELVRTRFGPEVVRPDVVQCLQLQ